MVCGQDRDGPRIRICKNGPYIVSGKVPLSEQVIGIDAQGESCDWRPGPDYAVQETYRLCRCGQSMHKPFCDNTHTAIGFDGTETASRAPFDEQAKEIPGPELTLADVQILCANARFCSRAGGIRNLTKRSDDPEARATAIQEACDCPSGRLVERDRQGQSIEPALPPSIGLVEDPKLGVRGPIWVRGGIPVDSADGYTYEVRNRVTLCRCGRSGNKPFCDGSHTRN